MLLELLISLVIVMYEVVAISSSVFMVADLNEQDSLNRNIQTIVNSSNQSTLIASRSPNNINSIDYDNGSLPISKGGTYFSGMQSSLLDQAKHVVVFRRKIDNNDYDFFIAQFKDSVGGKYNKFTKMGCFGIYKKTYSNDAELNNLVRCSEGTKYNIRYSNEGIYYFDIDYYGKINSFVLTFEYVNERNVY